MRRILIAAVVLFGSMLFAQSPKSQKMNELQTATFGSGCFWCTEAVFLDVKGVKSVASGYMGGKTKNPTYRDVCSGTTGHAEVIQLTYDPAQVTYEDLLEIFWNTHDPTTLNRQGNDEGTQYRSVVFFHDETQRTVATAYKKQLTDSKTFRDPIVTEITKASEFYKAEDYHQNYFAINPDQAYCRFVIRPKVEKFKKQFAAKLKK